MRRVIILGIAVGLAGTLPGPVGAGGPPFFSFQRTPSSGPPGTVISFSGECNEFTFVGDPPGVLSGSKVDVTLLDPDGNPVAMVTVTITEIDDGSYAGTITVPEGSPPGDYTLLAECYSRESPTVVLLELEEPFEVTRAAAPARPARAEVTLTG